MKSAYKLARENDFQNGEEYFNYIIESLINGQRGQVKSLFMELNKLDKREFLNDFLNVEDEHQKEVQEICIQALLLGGK